MDKVAFINGQFVMHTGLGDSWGAVIGLNMCKTVHKRLLHCVATCLGCSEVHS